MANHPYNMHREHQVAHRRVSEILKGEPEGAKKHFSGHAFSKVTSKTAAERHDAGVAGSKGAKRFARGGKVKGNTTNIIIAGGQAQKQPVPIPVPAGGPPLGGPPPGGPPPMGGPPPGGPPMPMRARGGKVKKAQGGDVKPVKEITPPIAPFTRRERGTFPLPYSSQTQGERDMDAMKTRARGGKISGGAATRKNLDELSARAEKNSYAKGGRITAGAFSGEGRLQKARIAKRK